MEVAKRTRKTWKREKTTEDSVYLNKILTLHKEGWSCRAISQIFDKDRTTILFHLRKLGVPKGLPRVFTQTVKTLKIQEKDLVETKESKYEVYLNEQINQGKTYAQYLKDAGKTPKQIRAALSEMRKNR